MAQLGDLREAGMMKPTKSIAEIELEARALVLRNTMCRKYRVL